MLEMLHDLIWTSYSKNIGILVIIYIYTYRYIYIDKRHILYENYVHLHLLLTKHSCTSLWDLYFPKL